MFNIRNNRQRVRQKRAQAGVFCCLSVAENTPVSPHFHLTFMKPWRSSFKSIERWNMLYINHLSLVELRCVFNVKVILNHARVWKQLWKPSDTENQAGRQGEAGYLSIPQNHDKYPGFISFNAKVFHFFDCYYLYCMATRDYQRCFHRHFIQAMGHMIMCKMKVGPLDIEGPLKSMAHSSIF